MVRFILLSRVQRRRDKDILKLGRRGNKEQNYRDQTKNLEEIKLSAGTTAHCPILRTDAPPVRFLLGQGSEEVVPARGDAIN